MIEQVKQYIIKNELENKAIEDFWIAFNNWEQENPEDYLKKFSNINPDDLNVFVHSIGLRASEWPECDHAHLTINVKIFHDGHEIGNYSDWFAMTTGVLGDDFLEI